MTKLAQYKEELSQLMDTLNDADTPQDIKDAIAPAIEKLKTLIKEEEAKGSKPAKAEKATAEKKPAPAKKTAPAKAPVKRIAAEKKPKATKEAPAKKAAMTALDKCKEILKKYKDKKKTDAERIEKRKKAGKPVELTPAETISKAATKVEAKVVDMERPLKVSEETAIANAVVKSVVSALEGITEAQRQKRFIQRIIESLQKLNKNIKLRAEDGMYVEEVELEEIEDMEDGEEMGEMAESLLGKVNEIHHHAKEIKDALQRGAEVEDWVLMKSTRASTDLSDIAHYLDNNVEGGNKMVFGGSFFKSAAPSKKWKADEFEEMNQALVDVYKNLRVVKDREIRKEIEEKVYEIQEILQTYGTEVMAYEDGGMMSNGGGITKYPTDIKVGTILKGVGFPMLKGIDNGKFYKVVEVDNFSATMVLTDSKGYRTGSKKIRHYLSSLEGSISTATSGDNNGILVVKYEDGGMMDDDGYMAKGGGVRGSKFKVGDKVMISDNGYVRFFAGFDLSEPATILEVNKVKLSSGTIYTYSVQLADGSRPSNNARESQLTLAEYADGGHMAKGGEIEDLRLEIEQLNRYLKKLENENTKEAYEESNYLRNHKAKLEAKILHLEDENEMASGGHMEKGGYNRSWHQDRARLNKSESWEIPMNQRKSYYAEGGRMGARPYPDLSKIQSKIID
jgi:hypothetical protein